MHEADPADISVRNAAEEGSQCVIFDHSVTAEFLAGDPAQIGLGLLHHGHVEEDAELPKLVIGPKAADGAGRGTDDCGRLSCPDAVTVWPGSDVDGILQAARQPAIIFRRAEDDPVLACDRLAEPDICRWRRGIEILAVERQVGDRHDFDVQAIASDRCYAFGNLEIDAVSAQAAGDDGDARAGGSCHDGTSL